MDSFEWNKIAGAVLGTFIFVLVVKFAADAVFEIEKPAKAGYVVEGVVEPSAAAGPAAAPAQEAPPDWGTALPTADAQAGQKISARCEQCHDLSKGGPNKIGPNLWGVVGRARATHPGFSYSGAMSADHGPWTFDKLFEFLKSPQTFVPGTKMTFAGLRSAKDRIDLIAWLRTQSDNPVPIPPPSAKSPATQAPNGPAPAEKAAPGQPPKAAPATPPKKA
ncbi:MAG TPA: cytochrome c family protein [Rhizomicrobium sp.]|nr:cytochrome c family protein [Rhizomicrobium sp.]